MKAKRKPSTKTKRKHAAEFWAKAGQRLRLTRLALGITEKEAAAAAEITVPTWRRWESGGHQKNGLYNYVRFCEKLHVDTVWLMFGAAEASDPAERRHVRIGRLSVLVAKRPPQQRIGAASSSPPAA
jgi:transcriptional regulator with XRE-family HTH domain